MGAFRSWLSSVLITVAAVATPAAAQTAQEVFAIKSGGWQGFAYKDELRGSFTHCAIWQTQPQGRLIMFGMDSVGGLTLGLGNSSWQIPTDHSSYVRVSVDDKVLGRFEASHLTTSSVGIAIGTEDSAFRFLQKGRTVFVYTGTDVLRYGLGGSYKALEKLRECVDLATSFSNPSTNPFLSSKPEDANPFSSLERRRGNRSPKWLRSLLDAAGMQDYFFVDPKDDAIAARWEAEGIEGFVTAVNIEDYTEKSFLLSMANEFGDECKGKLALASSDRETVGSYALHELYARCRKDSYELTMHIFGLFRKDGDALLITHFWDPSALKKNADATREIKRIFAVALAGN